MVAIPGPSIVPDRVLAAMHQPMSDIYAGPVADLSWQLVDELSLLARTSGHAYIVMGNGHAAWQMAICNTMSRGDRVLVLESGVFAGIWGEMAKTSGVDVEVVRSPDGHPFDPDELEMLLRADRDRAIKAVLTVHTDTASSVRNDIEALRRAIDDAGHPALFMVDCIASLGCERFEMDEWGVDVTVAASQKGLMMPPGLSFCWANARALAAVEHADLTTGYFDWPARTDPEAVYMLFHGTPPIPHLYGLRAALDMIAEEGLDNVWHRHEVLADAVRAAVEAWSTRDGIGFHIADERARSHSVTTITTGRIDANELRRVCEEQAGLTLGLGVGGDHARRFRIGHMGHLNPPMILGTIATVEAALVSMRASLGSSGAAAAAASIARALAD